MVAADLRHDGVPVHAQFAGDRADRPVCEADLPTPSFSA